MIVDALVEVFGWLTGHNRPQAVEADNEPARWPAGAAVYRVPLDRPDRAPQRPFAAPPELRNSPAAETSTA